VRKGRPFGSGMWAFTNYSVMHHGEIVFVVPPGAQDPPIPCPNLTVALVGLLQNGQLYAPTKGTCFLYQHSTTTWVKPRHTVSTSPNQALNCGNRDEWPWTARGYQRSVHLPVILCVSLARVSSPLLSISVTALSVSPSYVFLSVPR
jgi:hypothetical protein